MPEKKQPSYSLRFAIGLAAGTVLSVYIRRPPPLDIPTLNIILSELLLGVMLAVGYYYMFRGAVVNVNLPDGARIGFANAFFSVLGIIFGVIAGDLYMGHPLLHVASYGAINIASFAVTYHKLLKLYRDANAKKGEGPKRPD